MIAPQPVQQHRNGRVPDAGAATALPFVSVIIPCRNERDFIAACLDSVLATAYAPERLEVLVVDGMSDDGTRDILDRYAREYPCVRLLDNPKRITPAALNIGVINSRGSVIVRMDAHNDYPSSYIPMLVEWLDRSGADNVGGLWTTVPGQETPVAKAIAIGLSHPLGVGNALFRIGVREPRWVDTVPFGCYRREVFEKIGLFDEDLVRNQDDEFNARLIRHGGRILLVPDVVSQYYARASFSKLWRMYYQYGYFKPLAIQKLGAVPTIRQLVPALFVSAVAVSAALAPWLAPARWTLVAVLAAYAAAMAIASVRVAMRSGLGTALPLLAVFPILHVSYGVGFLRGVGDFLLLGRKRLGRVDAVPLSR